VLQCGSENAKNKKKSFSGSDNVFLLINKEEKRENIWSFQK